MRRQTYLLLLLAVMVGGTVVANAQRRSTVGDVCGDPTAKCRYSSDFQVYELAFDHGGPRSIIAESKPFYAVILKSVKLPQDQRGCEDKFPESERLQVQAQFPRNKVFAMRCNEAVQNYYTNIADNTSFLAVYGGKTLAQANAKLNNIQATGQFPGATIRRMRVGINGT
jgi:hypothetical protein